MIVEVGQISEDSDIQFIKDSILKTVDPWDSSNSDIVSFEPLPPQKVHRNDADLLSKYPAPQPSKFKISPVLTQSNLTRENYKERMHQLLSIEEMSQYQVDQKSIRTIISARQHDTARNIFLLHHPEINLYNVEMH